MPYRDRHPSGYRLIAILCVAAAAIGVVTVAGPATATPVDPKLSQRISSVTAELHHLARQGEQLDEQYNLAAAAVGAAQRVATQAQAAAAQATARYQATHARFVTAAVAQYEAGPDPSMGELLSSSSPQQYLDGTAQREYLATEFATSAQAQELVRSNAAAATKRAAAALAQARVEQATLAQRRTALRQQAVRSRQLLASLTARQRRELARARALAAAKARAALLGAQGAPGAAVALKSLSGPLQRVIAFAESQIGRAYVYGAAGPGAYDCSGLTMAAWAQVGLHLPHSAAQQYDYGVHVPYGKLQPGDLIFLYSPISHVELYIGNDLAVSAADPEMGIVITHPSQDLADFAGATRLAG